MILLRNGQTDMIIILRLLRYGPTTHKIQSLSLSGDTLPLSLSLSLALSYTDELFNFIPISGRWLFW